MTAAAAASSDGTSDVTSDGTSDGTPTRHPETANSMHITAHSASMPRRRLFFIKLRPPF